MMIPPFAYKDDIYLYIHTFFNSSFHENPYSPSTTQVAWCKIWPGLIAGAPTSGLLDLG